MKDKALDVAMEINVIRRHDTKFAAAIHEMGRWGCVREWKRMRELYNHGLTISSEWEFYCLHNEGHRKIYSKFGHHAWYNTMSL